MTMIDAQSYRSTLTAMGTADQSPLGMKYSPGTTLLVRLVLLVTSVGMLLFGLRLYFAGCGSCTLGVPYWAVLLSGMAWLATFGLFQVLKVRSARLLALTLTVLHISVLAVSSSQACAVCLSLFALEVVAVILLCIVSQRRSATFAMATITDFAIASIAMLIGYVASDRYLGLLHTVEMLSGRSDLFVTVVVRRNCGNCSEVETRMRELLATRLEAHVTITDERSVEGVQLVAKHGFQVFPAFIAVKGGVEIGVKEGGSVETFVSILERSISRLPKE